MSRKNKVFLLAIAVILLAIVFLFIWAVRNQKITPFAGTISSASLSFSPSFADLAVGEEFTTKILLNAQNLQSSGVEIVIQYDPEVIEIIDQDPWGSDIQLTASNLFPIVFENFVNPELGTIHFSASWEKGSPVFIKKNTVALAEIVFKPLKRGRKAQFSFNFTRGKTSGCQVFQQLGGVKQNVLLGVENAYYGVSR